jgi:hypothetical protein
MPNADGRRELPRRRNSGSPTSKNSENANFRESPKGEVRRNPIPRTPVNSLLAGSSGRFIGNSPLYVMLASELVVGPSKDME